MRDNENFARKNIASKLAACGLTLASVVVFMPSAQAASTFCDGPIQTCNIQSEGDGEGLQSYQVLEVRWSLDFGAYVSQIIGARARAPGNRSSSASVDQNSSTGIAGGASGERWSAWVGAAHSNIDQSFLKASGHANVALGGVDYTLANDVIVGVAGTVERSRTNSFGTRIEGDGYSLAPYVAIPLNANWLVDASLGIGRTDVDSITGAFVASAKDRRTFEALSLTYGTDMGKWQLQGKASYLGSKDKFTTPSTTSKLNQVRFGGQATYDAGSVLPYVGVTFIRDVSTPPPIIGSANDRDAIQLQAGVNIYSKGPLSGGLSYTYEANRKEIKNNVFVANLSYRF